MGKCDDLMGREGSEVDCFAATYLYLAMEQAKLIVGSTEIPRMKANKYKTSLFCDHNENSPTSQATWVYSTS